MNLFKQISEHLSEKSSVTIQISRLTEDPKKIHVMLVPKINSNLLGESNKVLSPIVFKGTPEEIDEKFLEIITTPLFRVNDVSSYIAALEKNLESVKTEAKKEAAKDKKKSAPVSKVEKKPEKKPEKPKDAQQVDAFAGNADKIGVENISKEKPTPTTQNQLKPGQGEKIFEDKDNPIEEAEKIHNKKFIEVSENKDNINQSSENDDEMQFF